MSLTRELRRRSRSAAPQVLLAALTVYFCYHAVQGEHGILAGTRLERELAQAQGLDDRLAAEQARLEHRVSLLRPDSLDPDMLEERAKALLNYGGRDEYVVYGANPDRPALH